jgi:glycosyltransferase involved in cell wall biosynthesis
VTDLPLVSVVTACHNAEAFVGETIDSVLAQSYPAVEHVIVDDASTDGSWEVIRGYEARFPGRVRGIRVERNRGPSHARNRGVEAARGELLMFLDSDDLITPDTLASLAEAVADRPLAVSFCDCKGWRKQADGSWGEAPRDIGIPGLDTDLFRAFLLHTAWPPTCSTLWRRDAYELTEGYDEEMVRDEDTDLLLHAHARGAHLVRARSGVGYYRSFEGTRASVSSGISEARFRSSMRVLDKLAAELDRHGRLADYADLLSRSYHKAALHGFQGGFRELARECLRKGEALTGPRLISTNPVGRALERLLGLERKESLARSLAELGVTTPRRRRALRMERAVRAAEPSS